MSYVYATPEIKATKAYQHAEKLEREYFGLEGPPNPSDRETLAAAWEAAGFLAWADNYRTGSIGR